MPLLLSSSFTMMRALRSPKLHGRRGHMACAQAAEHSSRGSASDTDLSVTAMAAWAQDLLSKRS